MFLPLVASCAWNAAGTTGCVLDRPIRPLPEPIPESSGLAVVGASIPAGEGGGHGDSTGDVRSLQVWTHNDSGSEPVLIAVDLAGNPVDSFRISAATGERIRDLEALEGAACPEGRCLYAADVGDNEERRTDVAIHRLVEPVPGRRGGDAPGAAGRGATGNPGVESTVLPVRFPDGPTDAEALFVLPGERIHLVSKGRNEPVTVYRYPLPLRPGRRVTLQPVQTLTEDPPLLPSYVTGASASPDGRTVAVRSYQALEFFRVRDGRLFRTAGMRVELRTLREAQGEAVTFLPHGRVALSSEAGLLGRRGGLAVLDCPGAAERRQSRRR